VVKLVITHLQEIAFTRNMQNPKTLFNIEGLFGDMLLMTRIVVEHFILSSMFMYILVENCQLVRITGLRYGYQIFQKLFQLKENTTQERNGEEFGYFRFFLNDFY